MTRAPGRPRLSKKAASAKKGRVRYKAVCPMQGKKVMKFNANLITFFRVMDARPHLSEPAAGSCLHGLLIALHADSGSDRSPLHHRAVVALIQKCL